MSKGYSNEEDGSTSDTTVDPESKSCSASESTTLSHCRGAADNDGGKYATTDILEQVPVSTVSQYLENIQQGTPKNEISALTDEYDTQDTFPVHSDLVDFLC